MNLGFLSPQPAASGTSDGAPPARSPMERLARTLQGHSEVRDGWSVITGYGDPERERAAATSTVAWVDVSHLSKLELQAAPSELGAIAAAVAPGLEFELGVATRAAGAWWCPLTPARLLVIGEPAPLAALAPELDRAAAAGAAPAQVTDVSTVFAALTVIGPEARELFARFCAIDLRDEVTPVRGLRPGSVARQPGLILREDELRYLVLFGWAVAAYMWTVVADAAGPRGGVPAGLDTLPALPEPRVRGGVEGARA